MQSPGEKSFIIDGFLQNLRSDGRDCEDFRPIALDMGVVLTANGSARCQIGGTSVIAAVKMDPVTPPPEHPDRGIVSLTVDLSCCVGPGMGRAGHERAIDWVSALEHCLLPNYTGEGSGLDLRQLCILEGRKVWNLGIDCLVLSVDGSVVDALSLAIKAALVTTEVPGLKVTDAPDSAQEPELEVDDESTSQLEASAVPLLISVHKVRGAYVVDATEEEAWCMTSCAHVGITPQGTIQGFSLATTAAVPPASLKEMAGVALRVAPSIFQAFSKFIDSSMAMEEDD